MVSADGAPGGGTRRGRTRRDLFHRLRRADRASSVSIAASIFLDIFNIFLFLLQLLGSERNGGTVHARCKK